MLACVAPRALLAGGVALLPMVAAAATAPGALLGERLPLWSVGPFAAMLLAIAVMPLVAGRFWEHNRNKALLSLVLGAPVAAWIATYDPRTVGHTLAEYLEFMLLLGSLFVIAGGVVLRGTLAGTPGLNAGLLALGAVAASFVGTTGASMLLIRPMLRANAVRRRVAHVVVFFIFVVSNAGGLLTPLGDPPLFLGFLREVPFLWTLRLWPEWLFVNGALIAIFYVVDSTSFRQEDLATPGDLDEIAVRHQVPLSLAGRRNLLYLAGVVVVLLVSGTWGLPPGVREGGLLLLVGLSWFTTRRELRAENGFTWGPIVEVAVVFAGIFCTMIPALAILNARGGALGIDAPWQFFWATGLLSSFLDNAPTYLTFAAAASAIQGTDAADLSQLLATERGAGYLAAISLGAVLMGANTYVGNGPNFMVKAIAEQSGVKMPGFFGYMAWSGVVLLPLFVVVTLLFLR